MSSVAPEAAKGYSSDEVDAVIAKLNEEYEKVHKEFEDNFWATKMALKGNSSEELTRTKNEYEAWLGDKERLRQVTEMLETPGLSEQQQHTLQILEKTFKCYMIEDPKAEALRKQTNGLESELQEQRNTMKLGYVDPQTNEFQSGSSVLLRTKMRTADDEPTRKACYEGLRAIGPFVAERFAVIVKKRNALAKSCGYEDFYDMKVQQAEGFSKQRLFEIMDGLEQQTRPLMVAARAKLGEEKGASALKPWNTGFALSGQLAKEEDPYFPFEDAVLRWGQSFAALGINYRGSTMRLDLCDREGKYSNGFCHWPQPAWRKKDGTWVPSAANFTSLASPAAVGSGQGALTTLMHEGGHAAHFANIDQPSPLFSQERAPTSVAYAENQSMFLDSLCGDASWLARYALDREGRAIPWQLIEKRIEQKHPYEVFMVRAMLAVPYFEKALYELPDEEVTAEAILALADRVEDEIQGGGAGRPLMSVPHILSDESSAYYHGYILAEMSVHQTREHFMRKYGEIVDNQLVGRDLTEVYWSPGNGESFLSLVEKLTGSPLTADAWVAKLNTPVPALLKTEKQAYDEAIKKGIAATDMNLGMRVILTHGDEVIADSEQKGFEAACTSFKQWVRATHFGEQAAVSTVA